MSVYKYMLSIIFDKLFFVQLARAVKYTDCTSARGGGWETPPNECPDIGH